jgi:hypothetical protein
MISNDTPDPDYFALVQEGMKPKGSTLPHSADWKGYGTGPMHPDDLKARQKRLDDENKITHMEHVEQGKKLYTLNPVEAEDYQYRFKSGANGRRRKLTKKQMGMAKYMLEGYTRRQAMLKAGYSQHVADKSVLSQQKTVLSFFEGVRGRFSKLGINEDFMAEKMAEWLNADKTIVTKNGEVSVPDYKTQIEAYDRFSKLIDPVKTDKGKKREIKLTEWISGEKEEKEEEQQS